MVLLLIFNAQQKHCNESSNILFQVTVSGVFLHVTVECRRLGRYCSEAVTTDSGKTCVAILRVDKSMSEKDTLLRQRSAIFVTVAVT